jgi:hypothetical protein
MKEDEDIVYQFGFAQEQEAKTWWFSLRPLQDSKSKN